MALPDSVDEIQLQVLVRGAPLLDSGYRVGVSTLEGYPVPGTLTVLAGEDPATPVTINVAGRKENRWRTFRSLTTTVPEQRTALLRMPVQWLCDETAVAMQGDTPANIVLSSTCDDGYTCIAGTCQENAIPEPQMPTYNTESVFGGPWDPEDPSKQGVCFDTLPCMITGEAVEPDADCTIARPEADSFNIALRVVEDGICDATRTTCFVPLDADSSEGWIPTEAGDRLQLPPAACEKKQQAAKVTAVYVSTACPTKFAGVPPCGSWSSVTARQAETPSDDELGEQAARPSIVAVLSSEAGQLCCPLMSNAGMLYSCACPSANEAQVISFDPTQTNSQAEVTRLQVEWNSSTNALLATTLVDGVLYWVRGDSLLRNSVVGSMSYPAIAVPATESVNSAAASLLADQTAAYLWVFGTDAADNSLVRLLKLTNSGGYDAFDLGSASAQQFAQDDTALYAVTDEDESAADGQPFARRSSVVRIDKITGARTTVLPERTLNTSDQLRGGYIGVQISEGKVFGLFEAEVANGQRTVQLVAANAADGADLTTLFETAVDDTRTRYSLLGVVQGNSVLVRLESGLVDGAAGVLSSSLQAVPASGASARFIADFARDYPLQGLAVVGDNFYWLNIKGKLFALPVRTLQ